MQVSFLKHPKPTTPAAVTRPRAIIWKCDRVTHPDRAYYRFYRYETSTDASGHTNYTVEDQLPTPRYRDEEALTDDVTSWGRWSWVDTWGNESALSDVVSEKNKRIGATDLDQTAPDVPSVVLAGYGDDFDEDGTMDAGIVMTVTHPSSGGVASGVPSVRYIVKLQRRLVSDGVSGTYADFPKNKVSFDAEDVAETLTTIHQIRLNRKYFYRAQVRGISFGSRRSAFSAAPTSGGTRPSAATGYTGQAVAGPSVQSIANGFTITASLGALDPTLFRSMAIFVNGSPTALATVQTLSYTDMTPRTIGAQPSYRVTLYDKSGNPTALSGVTIPISPGFRATTSAEIGTGAVIDTNLGAGAVGSVALADQAVATAKLADKAVTYNKLYGFSSFNVVPDFELSDPAYWLFEEIVSGVYTALPSANATKSGNPTSDNRGYSDFKYRVTSTANNRSTSVTTTPMPVEEGVVYTFSWFIENLRATDRNINNYMLCYSQDAAGNLVHVSTILAGTKPISAGVALPGASGVWRYSNIRVPNGITHIAARTLVSGVSGDINDFYFASPKMQALTPAGDVTRWVNVPTFAYGTFGNSAQRVTIVTLPEYNRTPLKRRIFFAMKNLSGGAARFSVQLETRLAPFTGSWTVLRTIGAPLRDDEYWSTELFIGKDTFEDTLSPSTSGIDPDTVQYAILLTPSQAGNNLSQVEMRVETTFA